MSYLGKVQETIDYIEIHLRDEIDLELVTDSTDFSRWHYQRIFKACTGHSIGDYLAKRRLSLAAEELRLTKRSILDIAIDFQFGSHEAFSRAFKRYFNSTPREYRNGECKNLTFPRLKINFDYLKHLYRGVSMTPNLKEFEKLTIVGIKGEFIKALDPQSDNMEIIPKLWNDFFSRIGEIKNISGPTVGAIDSSTNTPKQMDYIAGIEVSSVSDLPEGMVSLEIPKGKYAEFIHEGPVSNIDKTLDYIYGSWLPSSKLQRTDGPEYEVYPENYNPDSETAKMSLRIPIKS